MARRGVMQRLLDLIAKGREEARRQRVKQAAQEQAAQEQALKEASEARKKEGKWRTR